MIIHQYGGRIGGRSSSRACSTATRRSSSSTWRRFYQPTEASRTRTILHPRQSQEGWFRYNVTVGGVQQVREVNLLTLAQQNNQLATLDPITRGRSLRNVRAAAGTAGGDHGSCTNPNDGGILLPECRHEPSSTRRTGRVDYQRVVGTTG